MEFFLHGCKYKILKLEKNMNYDEQLFQENLNTAKVFYPHIYQKLREISHISSEIIADNQDNITNIQYNNRLIYENNLADNLAKIFDNNHNKPILFDIHTYMATDPGDTNSLTNIVHHIHHQFIKPNLLESINSESDGGLLIVFGAGLGDHIAMILAKYRHFNLTIIEESAEILYHTMHRFSLAKWRETMMARGGKLQIWMDSDTEQCAYRIYNDLAVDSYGYADGSRIFFHYDNLYFNEIYKKLNEILPNAFANNGFVDDEKTMLKHYYENLKIPHYKMARQNPAQLLEIPIFVIANGPSLDKSAEFIKKFQDKALIISCGTALESVLKLGIMPDFHAELENTEEIKVIHSREIIQKHKNTICLLASLSVVPEVPKQFMNAILYFRDSLSPSVLLSPENIIDMTSPNCANLATRMAVALGAQEVYLFGVDFGKRHDSAEHSKSSIYEDFDTAVAQNYTNLNRFANSTDMMANFGGLVQVHGLFMQAKFYISVAMQNAASQCKFYNCSDGVLFEPAIATIPEILDFNHHHDKFAIKQKLIDSQALLSDIVPNFRQEYQNLMQEFSKFIPQLQNIINNLTADTQPIEFYHQIKQLLSRFQSTPAQKALSHCVNGSVLFTSFIYAATHRRIKREYHENLCTITKNNLLAIMAKIQDIQFND